MTAYPKIGILCTVMSDSFVETLEAEKGPMRENQGKKGTLVFSMQSLIGDRFLKRFFGSRLHRSWVNPIGEEKSLPENAAAEPAEPECPPNKDLSKKEAMLENNKTGETNRT